MRILVTNDDGIYSPGIAALAAVASRLGDVRIGRQEAPRDDALSQAAAPLVATSLAGGAAGASVRTSAASGSRSAARLA